ncbi:MAG: hypothetical protein FJW23_15555 [Acidimicrobiia bacterium]|nr:hypothetical protein [Acidimicrobiia bacterium]
MTSPLCRGVFAFVTAMTLPAATLVSSSSGREPQPDDERAGHVTYLRGSCPEVTFMLERVLVTASKATHYDGGCERLHDGAPVVVEGLRQADGSVAAVRIAVGDRERKGQPSPAGHGSAARR